MHAGARPDPTTGARAVPIHQTSSFVFGSPDEAADLFIRVTHGYAGVGADSLSVAECIGASVPIMHLLGSRHLSGSG
ncbi:MAG: hypothetical protein ACO3D0_04130, partial [Ilumatobacteraceae bacterium]